MIYQTGGNCYSINFVDSDETVWCDSISEIYMAIEQYVKEMKGKQ